MICYYMIYFVRGETSKDRKSQSQRSRQPDSHHILLLLVVVLLYVYIYIYMHIYIYIYIIIIIIIIYIYIYIYGLHFSICTRHPCAGAMLVFSVSFKFLTMPGKTSYIILYDMICYYIVLHH